MPVSCHQGELVLHRHRSDPDIVFGDWSSLGMQLILDVSILSSSYCVARQDGIARDQCVDAYEVRLYAGGFVGAVIEFTHYNTGDKYFVGRSVSLMTIFVSSKNLPILAMHVLTSFLNGLRHENQILRINGTGKTQ
jgi:hypothetical protein